MSFRRRNLVGVSRVFERKVDVSKEIKVPETSPVGSGTGNGVKIEGGEAGVLESDVSSLVENNGKGRDKVGRLR